jgi:nitrate/TMAO reductase-like tetraheme cytochrome c subunit
MKARRMLGLVSVTTAMLTAVVLLYGCGGESTKETTLSIQDTFRTSLHATRLGKATWYSRANGGFEGLTNVSITQMGCMKCHPGTKADGTPIDPATYQPGCDDCHTSPGSPVSDQICLKCHSRQAREMQFYSDIHRQKGFRCMSCHTLEDVHGDGRQYAAWLEPGAVKAKCENCHPQVTSNPAHNIHTKDVDCLACHTQSIVSCYNCHLQSEIQGNVKRPHTLLKDYMLLLRRKDTGKVYTGTIMTLNYNDKTFVAVAPYRAHTIARNARKCEDCHDNAAIREYNQTGRIVLTTWDGSKVVNKKGVIPVPPDWQTAFQLDFVDYTGDPTSPTTDPTKWVFLKTGADGKQMLYAEPLSQEQLQKLSQPYTSP